MSRHPEDKAENRRNVLAERPKGFAGPGWIAGGRRIPKPHIKICPHCGTYNHSTVVECEGCGETLEPRKVAASK